MVWHKYNNVLGVRSNFFVNSLVTNSIMTIVFYGFLCRKALPDCLLYLFHI